MTDEELNFVHGAHEKADCGCPAVAAGVEAELGWQ